jgi:putative ABC transport system substrate-binding protein
MPDAPEEVTMRLGALALLVTLALGILGVPPAGDAQPAGKVYRIGYLNPHSPATSPGLIDAFRQGLREHGYIEGQNITIEYRWAEERIERLPDLATELVRLKVDLIVVSTDPGALAAKKATSTIPIVFVAVTDPVGLGLVVSLGRPGGNMTGLPHIARELTPKRLELLKEAVPGATRVAVLWGPDTRLRGLREVLKPIEIAARKLGVQLQSLEVQNPDELATAFSALTRKRADALLLVNEALFYSERARIVELAAKSRLPVMAWLSVFVEAGGLISYGPNLVEQWRRLAYYVDRILKGAKPADLPVEQPMTLELVINLKTAKALGLTIPHSVLFRADKLIE